MEVIYNTGDLGKLAKDISQVTLREPNLSFRPKSLILNSILNNNLLFYQRKGLVVGWIETYPIVNKVWGISTLFIYPPFRGRHYSTKLINKAVTRLTGKNIFINVSFVGNVLTLKKLGFKEINFMDLPFTDWTSIIIKRYYHPLTWFKYFFYSRLKSKCYYKQC